MKGKRKINESDEAVVGIVVTVLLIGLVLSVTVMINNVYVPQWVEKEEVNHMDEVSYQFSQLKYAIDMQSIINGSTTMSTGVTLGSREIPIFNAGRSYGSLIIDPGSCIISINSSSLNQTFYTDSIKYSSGNSYYVNQEYIYQAGALILYQDNANVLLGKPSLTVSRPNFEGDEKEIKFNVVNIQGVKGKTSGGGFGTYEIFTQITNPSMEYIMFENVSKMTIITPYPNAWNTSLKRSFLQSGRVINYTAEISPNNLEINFYQDENKGYYYDLLVREIEVRTEIGFGISND